MPTSLHAALDDVSNRLEALKATLKVDGLASTEGAPLVTETDSKLLAIQQAALDLECMLRGAQAGVVDGGISGEQPLTQLGQPPRQQAAAPQKLVDVPIRKRSNRSGASTAQRSIAPPAAAPQGFRQVPLPATPPPADEVLPTPADKGPKPAAPAVADMPATTPLAAEVLVGLGLGALASAAAGAAEGGSPRHTPPLRQLSDSSVAGGVHRSSSVEASMSALAAAAAGATAEHRDSTSLPPVVAEPEVQPRPSTAAAHIAAAAAVAAFTAAGPLSRPRASAAQEQRRGCNCKRSMCLKMYCECFAAGGFCMPGCACANCYNHQAEAASVQQARKVVLAKDPHAFEKKVTAAEGHKRGCHCKRSKCMKKYCECFHAGAKCNPDICQCEGCKNTDDAAVTPPLLTSSASPQSEALGSAPWQAPVMLPALRVLGPIMPLQQQDTPEASLLDRADSSGNSHGLTLAQQQQGAPGGSAPAAPRAARRGVFRIQMQQPQGQAGMGAAAPRLAFAGFPVAAFQQAAGDGSGVPGPFLVAPPGAMMPGLFPGMGMPPFVFNPMAVAASLAASGQPQLPPILLPIAPLHTAAPPPPIGATAAEDETASHGDAVSLLAAAASGAAEVLPAVLAAEEAALPPAAVAIASATGAGEEDADVAAAAMVGATTSTPASQVAPKQGSVALTAHLSEVAGAIDPDMRDTATSPAPHVAVSRVPGPKPTAAATLTARRPPGGPSRSESEEQSLGSAWCSGNGRAESTTTSAAGADSSQCSKRPRRVASSGVMGAVAAEAAAWGDEWASPPKRLPSVQVGGGPGHRGKAPGRFALLKKALEAETMHAQKRARGRPPATRDGCIASVAADEEDVISALFELSSSMC